MSAHMDKTGPPGADRLRLHCLATAIFLLVVITFRSLPVSADEIYFKSGHSSTAVVLNETDTSITFRTELGMLTLGLDKIDFVDKATPEENQALRRKWREDELKKKESMEAKKEALRRFEEEQIARGLVKFEDNWMTPEQRREILDLRDRARRHRRAFEEEQKGKGLQKFQHLWVTAETAKELSDMEKEIESLLADIANQEKVIESLREAMSNAASLEEADGFRDRIETTGTIVAEKNEELERLFQRADDIEAKSIRYVPPDEFLDVLLPEDIEAE